MLATVNASPIRCVAATFLAAVAGGALFEWLRMPAGWLSGAMLFVALATLSGLNSQVPEKSRWAFFLVLGIFAGSGANPQTLEQIATWPASFGMLMISVAAVSMAGYLLLHRLFAWDGPTALFAALPGGMSFVLAAVEGMDVDIRKVAVAQSIRLLILVEIFPLAVLMAGGPTGSSATRCSSCCSPSCSNDSCSSPFPGGRSAGARASMSRWSRSYSTKSTRSRSSWKLPDPRKRVTDSG